MKKSKRFLISTTETFVATFVATFFMQIEQILNAGSLPTKEILVSGIIAGFVSGTKAIIKFIRENYVSE